MRVKGFIAGLAAMTALAGAAFAQSADLNPARTGPDAPPVRTVNPQRMEDLAVFRRDFLERDQSFSAQARAAANARLGTLIAEADGLTDAQFEVEIARIAALADNGHTDAFPAYRAARYNRAPIRVAPMSGGFYVLRARGEDADLLGAELIGVDGRPFSETRAAAYALTGGEEGWRATLAPYFFESPQLLFAAGMSDGPEGARYAFRLRDGSVITRYLQGEYGTDFWRRLETQRWFWPQPAAVESADWRSALAPSHAPFVFTEPQRAFRWRDAPELDAFVIEFRQNRDALGARIGDFIAQAEMARRESRRRHLILDMRFNTGGDLTTTQAYMRDLGRSVRGHIVVLTSPWTFSAAIASIGYLKQSGRDRVTLVGEPVGDRLRFWAEGDFVTLPHSGVRLLYADGFHDYITGCAGFTCHPAVELRPIAVPSLAPDIAAPMTIEAYLAGRDPAMEAAAAFLSALP